MKRGVFNAVLLIGLLFLLVWVVIRAIQKDWAQATFFFLIALVLAFFFDRGKVKPSDTFFNPKKKY
jgi:hypothetical protein